MNVKICEYHNINFSHDISRNLGVAKAFSLFHFKLLLMLFLFLNIKGNK